ncbi:MAG: transposase [Polyangiaceae bacterium]
MANVLTEERRLAVLAVLVNGGSVRAAERQTGVHRDTIVRLMLSIGEGCQRLHDRMVRDLACPFVDFDEQHSWCGKRQAHVQEGDGADVGEQWTWASICRTSQFVIAWHVGKRDAASAEIIVGDTRARLAVMPQVATDGLALYEAPIARHFSRAVPYVQTIKRFAHGGGGRPGFAEKFSHARGVDFIEKRAVLGAPDMSKATTYAIERSNLTNRQWNARLHRRTLAFSKRLDSHRASIAIGYVYRNLCHVPRNMRVSPAMAAGVTDRLWTLAELLAAVLAEKEGDKPAAQPLTIPKPEGAARELPGGRGWLRVLPGGPGGPAPSPAPATPPAAPAASSGLTFDADGQADLFSWTPKARPLPPRGTQLDLFWDPPPEGR